MADAQLSPPPPGWPAHERALFKPLLALPDQMPSHHRMANGGVQIARKRTLQLMPPATITLTAQGATGRYNLEAVPDIAQAMRTICSPKATDPVDLTPLKQSLRALLDTTTTHSRALRTPAYRRIAHALTLLAGFLGPILRSAFALAF